VTAVIEGKTASAVRLGRKSALAIALASAIGVIAFGWPLLAPPGSSVIAHADDAPWIFGIFTPVVLFVVLAQIADRDIEAKGIALLGVLAAVIAVLRPLGGGLAGLEPIWVVLILAGRALGPGFGFALGSISLFASALITGGVGPWLPFQMIAAGWVGLGAGLLPRRFTGAAEIALVGTYAAFACIAYGFIMNLWFWPFSTNLPAQIAFAPGAPLMENLVNWWRFNLITSLGYDLPRATLTVLLIILAGRPILIGLRRVSRLASFDTELRIEPAANR
jgi:energy-coupling factor transport system substrate-specific component|tara:strand:+ start:5844 stop:6674 length:831 start_codon:yes stop_codon:yes gene_type:complete